MAEHRPHPLADEAAAYVLGALSAEEAAQFEAALAGDAALQGEVARLQAVTADLVDAMSAAPPPGLRGRVIDRVRDEVQRDAELAVTRRPRLGPILAIAAGLAVVGVLGFAWLTIRRENAALSGSVAALEAQLEQARTDLADNQELLDVLLAPEMRIDLVESTGEARPVLRLFRDPQRRIAIAMTQNLPPAPDGRTYQLWFIRDGVPVPSVTFNTASDGRVAPIRVELPAGDGEITHAAVTEEPSGGSAQPTTTPFLVGELTR